MLKQLVRSTFRSLCGRQEYIILQNLRAAWTRVEYWRQQTEEISADWWSNYEGGPGGALKLATIEALAPAYQKKIANARAWLKYNEQLYRRALRAALSANIPRWKIALTKF